MATINGTTSVPNTSFPSSQACDQMALLDPVTVKVIKTAAYSIMLLLSLVGNSVVPAIVYRNPKLHTSINYIIVSMSISDLLIPIFTLPQRIKQIYVSHEIWQIDGAFGSLLCKLVPFATNTSIIVTVVSLVIVSFERFFAIVYPFKRQPLRSKKACFSIIALTWIIAIFYSLQTIYTWRLTTENATTYCRHGWESAFERVEANRIESIVFSICFLMIPFVTTASFYIAIIFSLRSKKTPQNLGSTQISQMEKENRRVTYMLLIVVVVFLIPSIASNIFVFISFAGIVTKLCKTRHVMFVLTYLSYIYQAINPYIYYVFHPRYRKGAKKILSCKRRSIETDQEMPVRLQLLRTASLEPSDARFRVQNYRA